MSGVTAAADVAKIQKPNFALNTPSHVPIYTSKTLELRLRKLPKKAREVFLVNDVPHNLVDIATLVDAGCGVHMYYWGFEVDYNGETICKGWRELNSKLFKMSLVDDGTERVVAETDRSEYDGSNGLVMSVIQWSVNSIYKCQNREQLVKYYHASLGSHVKSTFQAAARAGYLQGCPGLYLDGNNKYVAVIRRRHGNGSHDQSDSRRAVDHNKVEQGQDGQRNPLLGEVRGG